MLGFENFISNLSFKVSLQTITYVESLNICAI